MTLVRAWPATVFLLLLSTSLFAGPSAKATGHAISSSARAPLAGDLFVRVLRADDLFAYKGRQITNYWVPGRTTAVTVFNLPPDSRRIEYLVAGAPARAAACQRRPPAVAV